MSNAYFKPPQPINEPIKTYKPSSPEREELKKKLEELRSQQIEVPLIIGGKEVKTGNTEEMRIPHNHNHVLGVYRCGFSHVFGLGRCSGRRTGVGRV